jgi:hypothetical protein
VDRWGLHGQQRSDWLLLLRWYLDGFATCGWDRRASWPRKTRHLQLQKLKLLLESTAIPLWLPGLGQSVIRMTVWVDISWGADATGSGLVDAAAALERVNSVSLRKGCPNGQPFLL